MNLSKKLLMYLSMKTPIAQDYETFFIISMRAKFQFDVFFTCATSPQSKFLSTHSRFISIIAVKKCLLASASF